MDVTKGPIGGGHLSPSLDRSASVAIRASSRHVIRAVRVGRPLLIRVDRGVKRLEGAAAAGICPANSLLVIDAPTEWDIVNDPGTGAEYRARVIELGPAELARGTGRRAPATSAASSGHCRTHACDAELDAAFERAWNTLERAPGSTLAAHRVVEVLLMLGEREVPVNGHLDEGPIERMFRLVSSRPARPWTASDMARALGVGDSTLRRRLSSAGTTWREVLQGARLEVALGMLQGSDAPIGEIAGRVGYESHGRFSAAFRRRYGLAPQALRASLRDGSSGSARPTSVPGRAAARESGSLSVSPRHPKDLRR